MAEYLDIEQASKRLGKSTKTLRRWVHMQKIPYRMDNRKIYFDVADLEAKRTEESPDKMDTSALLERIEGIEVSLQSISERLAQLEAQIHTAPIPAVSRPTTLRKTHLVHNGGHLPDGLVGWRQFADLHNIAQSTVQRAIESNRLPVQRGSWKQGRATVQQALDAAGRSRFYELFCTNPGFKICATCPHDV